MSAAKSATDPNLTATQGSSVHRKLFAHTSPDDDIFIRTSWKDARTALDQIKKGRASGNRAGLWIRVRLQEHLYAVGCSIQSHAGKVLFVGLFILAVFCVGLKSATIQTDLDKLWVAEGGRLEAELRYVRSTLGEGAGTTSQLLIQTPRGSSSSSNVLHPDALLVHLAAVSVVTQVTIDMFEVTWKLKDLCYSPSFPSFDTHYIDSMLDSLFPCAIITPLDCFWEGSKLLGPEYPVYVPGLAEGLQWTDLNPRWLIDTMKSFDNFANSFPFSTLEDFLKRAGITTAYQERPCLNPHDPGCPTTAPNKESKKTPDIGAELTGGCYGFATNYMHWPEDLIVGGVTKNKTGHIVKAEALQSLIQLMGEKDMYDFWKDTYKVHSMDWNPDKARMILEAWQDKFTQEVRDFSRNQNLSRQHNIDVFSTSSLSAIMKDFSEVSLSRVVLGYLLMVGYAFVSLRHWADCVQSQSGIGVAGVLLVSLSIGAGLGFCAIIGIVFNASTTQIIPFLALGLGVDDLFLLAHTFARNATTDIPLEEQTGECLKQTGVNVLLSSAGQSGAFFAAALVPIPALRSFCLQVAVLGLFRTAVILLIFPAVVSLDLRRHKAHRMDILCCFHGNCYSGLDPEAGLKDSSVTLGGGNKVKELPRKKQAVAHALPPELVTVVTTVLTPQTKRTSSRTPHECWVDAGRPVLAKAPEPEKSVPEEVSCRRKCLGWNITWFAVQHYSPFLLKTPIKVLTILTFGCLLVASVWGLLRVHEGLDLTDVVPRSTGEYRFLSAQAQYFGFFHMLAVTQGNFEYPTNQKLLHEYHQAFTSIDRIVKNDDGGTPDFWLALFRDWLLGLQVAFDRDVSRGSIEKEHWSSNASNEGILAYKLIVQTGRVDNPIDKSLVETGRLVDSEGVINPKAFYNYLTAWVTNDALAYSTSQANFRPEPRHWVHLAQDVELKIPKSQPLVYTQLPFYLSNLSATQDILSTLEAVRALCSKFSERGLPNFPTGVPFVFWEQYIGLRFYLGLALASLLVVLFLVITLVLMNPWAAAVTVVVVLLMVVQLFGSLGLLGIKLNALPAVILIASVGVGLNFTLHIVLGFLTSIGGRDRRVSMALEQMSTPLVHGAASTLLGISMLAFSEFDFIVRYFFHILLSLIIIGILNGLVLLPVMLSLLGPPGEVVPHVHEERISTPSPRLAAAPRPIRARQPRPLSTGGGGALPDCGRTSSTLSSSSRGCKGGFSGRADSEASLSTITEEPASYHSSGEMIVVQPELVLETTTVTSGLPGTIVTSVNGDMNSGGVGMTEGVSVPPSSARSSPSGQESDRSASSMSSCSTTSSGGGNSGLPHTVTTKVTATAKVKVEVHTPMHSIRGPKDRSQNYRCHYRTDR